MKKRVTILMAIFLFGQHPSFSQKKSTHLVEPKYSEMDFLAKKYQGIRAITITTPTVSEHAKVSIDYNQSGEPYAISFTGVDSFRMFDDGSYSISRVEKLLHILRDQKLSEGYTYSKTLSKGLDKVYTKGNMLTRFTLGSHYPVIYVDPKITIITQYFTIHTEDLSRSRDLNSTNFRF